MVILKVKCWHKNKKKAFLPQHFEMEGVIWERQYCLFLNRKKWSCNSRSLSEPMKVKGNLSVVVGWTVYGDRQVTVQITASRGRRHRHVCQSVSVHSKKKIKIHLSFSHSYLLKHLKLSSWYRLEPFHSKWDKYAGFMFYSVSCINTASVLFVRKKKKKSPENSICTL